MMEWLIRADGFDLFDLLDEHFSVTDPACAGVFEQRGFHAGDGAVLAVNFEPRFGQEGPLVFAATIEFELPFLAAVTAHFGDQDFDDARARQAVYEGLKLEGLDVRFEFFHRLLILTFNYENDEDFLTANYANFRE